MGQQYGHFTDEPDIGSGEKTPGQEDVDNDVRSVDGSVVGQPIDGRQHHQVAEEQRYAERPPGRAGEHGATAQHTGRVLQDGIHLARVVAQRLDDGTYEAQVYVRLAREPEIAETYIPAGTFGNEQEAWRAAEERAQRAFAEHEF
jgi:hypothetical protein